MGWISFLRMRVMRTEGSREPDLRILGDRLDV